MNFLQKTLLVVGYPMTKLIPLFSVFQIMQKHCPYLMGPIESLRDLVSPDTDIKVQHVLLRFGKLNII